MYKNAARVGDAVAARTGAGAMTSNNGNAKPAPMPRKRVRLEILQLPRVFEIVVKGDLVGGGVKRKNLTFKKFCQTPVQAHSQSPNVLPQHA